MGALDDTSAITEPIHSPNLQASSDNTAPWWGRISLLWLMFVPLCVLLYTLCLGIAPNDFWYHVRAGWAITTEGKIPTIALFTSSPWVPSGTPYFYQSWISEIIFYKVLATWGLDGIVITRSLCMLLTFVVLTIIIQRRCWNLVREHLQLLNAATNRPQSTPGLSALDTPVARITALSTLAALALAASNMDVRPQIFSVPLFTLFVAALFAWPDLSHRARTIVSVALALAMTVWANTHGAFFTGLILLFVAFGAESVSRWWSRGPGSQFIAGAALSLRAYVALGALVLACIFAAMLNPRGAGIYVYVKNLARNETGQKYIQEWKAPTLDEWYSVVFFLSILVLITLIIVLMRQATTASGSFSRYGVLGVRPAELAMLVVLALMSFRDIRSIIWYGFLFAPVFAACCTRLLLHFQTSGIANGNKEAAAVTPRGIYVMNAFMACLLLLMIVPVLPPFKSQLPLPKDYTSHFAPKPRGAFPVGFAGDPPLLLERETPVEAAEFLRRNPPRRLLFNDMVFGSYLTWALYPQILPSSDPRVELFPTEFWDEYSRLSQGPPDAAQTLRNKGFSDALLHTKRQEKLIRQLQQSGWQLIFKAGPAVLLRDK